MAAKRTTTVGLNHPTVVPENHRDETHDEHTVWCPACGRPLADH